MLLVVTSSPFHFFSALFFLFLSEGSRAGSCPGITWGRLLGTAVYGYDCPPMVLPTMLWGAHMTAECPSSTCCTRSCRD